MKLSLMLALFLLIYPCVAMGGRAQRRQRQAEDRLTAYIGRVDPEKLCELLKCHSPVGSWCQVVQEKGILIPKCVCPRSCPRQKAPVCSVLGKTYGNECLLHKDACRRRHRTRLAHTGPCLGKHTQHATNHTISTVLSSFLNLLCYSPLSVPKSECTEEELGQFPYRLLDWFLLLRRMGGSYAPAALPQTCLSHAQRTQLAEERFTLLDKNKDGKLSWRDLRKLYYKKMPLEQCATPFFLSCDRNKNKKVTVKEWTACLVDRSEAWFYNFMSMEMGSHQLCPTAKHGLPRLL
ncbi:SPARC [Fundulus diaphanus]